MSRAGPRLCLCALCPHAVTLCMRSPVSQMLLRFPKLCWAVALLVEVLERMVLLLTEKWTIRVWGWGCIGEFCYGCFCLENLLEQALQQPGRGLVCRREQAGQLGAQEGEALGIRQVSLQHHPKTCRVQPRGRGQREQKESRMWEGAVPRQSAACRLPPELVSALGPVRFLRILSAPPRHAHLLTTCGPLSAGERRDVCRGRAAAA